MKAKTKCNMDTSFFLYKNWDIDPRIHLVLNYFGAFVHCQ